MFGPNQMSWPWRCDFVGVIPTTFTVVAPETPPAVAVIVAAPAASPEATPAADTPTVAASELVQVGAIPDKTAPWASFTVAVSGSGRPTLTIAGVGPIDTNAGLESGAAESPQLAVNGRPPASISAAARASGGIDETFGLRGFRIAITPSDSHMGGPGDRVHTTWTAARQVHIRHAMAPPEQPCCALSVKQESSAWAATNALPVALSGHAVAFAERRQDGNGS